MCPIVPICSQRTLRGHGRHAETAGGTSLVEGRSDAFAVLRQMGLCCFRGGKNKARAVQFEEVSRLVLGTNLVDEEALLEHMLAFDPL